MEQIRHIRIDKLKPPEFDQRITESPVEDDELMESIKELGILEPLIIKEVTDGFEIIAGNRRLKQAGRAGLAAVPCIVVKTTGAASEKIKLHENIHRLPLSHIDQGYTFAHLIKLYNMTEQQVATLSHRSIAYVSQHLSLIQSDPTLVNSVHDGRINFSVARELMRCKDSDERQRFQNIAENSGATQYVVRTWVDESNKETDNINETVREQNPNPSYEKPQIPMYPCAACEVPTSIIEMKTVRLCPECHHLIFTEIEREKFKARSNPS
jgi:ParB family chromosome partitioning protein